MTAEQEVWRTVQALNRTWTREGRPAALAEYFHRDMVVIDPVRPLRTEGGTAAVAAWTEFTASAETQSWEERDPKVQLYAGGTVAIVTYYYDMVFTSGGEEIRTSGRDLMVLVREEGQWWVVADHFSPTPPQG